MWRVFGWALGWAFRGVVVKFVILTAIFGVVAFLVPYAVNSLGSFLNTSVLTSAFSAITPGMWYFLDAMQMAFGLPLVISAYIARFTIRRLPVIG